MCKTDSLAGSCCIDRELSLVLCDGLEGWDGGGVGGMLKRKGYMYKSYIYMIHVVVQQKLIQHYKATIPQ